MLTEIYAVRLPLEAAKAAREPMTWEIERDAFAGPKPARKPRLRPALRQLLIRAGALFRSMAAHAETIAARAEAIATML